MKWTPWSKSNTIPFKAELAVGDASSKMVGNGEHKLAYELDAEVIGGRYSTYDLLDAAGRRIEVKAFGPFRFSVCGHAHSVMTKLIDIANILQFSMSDVHGREFVKLKNRIDEIVVSMKKGVGVQNVMGRTFKNKRESILGLKQIIEILNEMRMEHGSADTVEGIISDDYVEMSKVQFIRIARILDLRIEPQKDIDTVFSYLDESFYDDDRIEFLWSSVLPSNVLFEHADMVVIVHENLGYMAFFGKEIDGFIKFGGFSKGDVIFSLRPELKRINAQVVEHTLPTEERDSSKRIGNFRKKEQESTVRVDNETSLSDGRTEISDRVH